MKELIEKIISYILGGMVTVSLGMIASSLKIISYETDYTIIIFVLIAIIGVISSALIFEYKEDKQAKKNNKIRNETITLITHEMRTGLTSTSWTLQSILDNYNDKLAINDQKILKGVISSIHAIVAHSVNLLDISVLDVKKLLIDLKWVTLLQVEEMFLESIEKYKILCQQKGITIITNIHLDNKREVEVDLMRLRVIFENFIENAIQYMLNNKKEIVISIDNNITNLNLKISDTGIGIPLLEQNKIFSQFFRASNAREKLVAGSGIGLYMSKKYVEAHRGHITFKSTENEGTTFFVDIPLKTSENIGEFLEKI